MICKAMFIGVAYASNIGGITTLPGTSPNLIFSEYLNQWVCVLLGSIRQNVEKRKTHNRVFLSKVHFLLLGFIQTATALTLGSGSSCASPSLLSCCCWHGYGCTGSSLAQSESLHAVFGTNPFLSVYCNVTVFHSVWPWQFHLVSLRLLSLLCVILVGDTVQYEATLMHWSVLLHHLITSQPGDNIYNLLYHPMNPK